MFRVCLSMLALTVTCLQLSESTVRAQQPDPYAGLKAVKASGKISEVAPGGVLLLKDAMNKDVAVKIMPTTKISVNGTAEADFLKTGTFVQFTTNVTPGGKQAVVDGELGEVMVCEMSDIITPAFSLEGDAPAKKDASAKYFVRGKIMKNVKGDLSIMAGTTQVKAKLSPTAKIDVKVTDFTLAQAGDDVAVDGREFAPGQIIGNTVDITIINPLVGKKRPKAAMKKAGS
jgi:hypothetical protein